MLASFLAAFGLNAYHRIVARLVFTALWFLVLHAPRRARRARSREIAAAQARH